MHNIVYRRTIVATVTSVFLLSLGCYNAVPINHKKDKWWEEECTWINAKGYEGRIKVTRVVADSVYGEMDLGHATPTYKRVVVPMDSVEIVKKKELDPVKTIFGSVLFASFAFGVAFLISLSKVNLD